MIRFILISLLIISSQVQADTSECSQESACVQISAKSETFIEGLTMLLPKTTNELILGDGVLSSAIKSIASLSNNAAKKLLNANDVTIISTPVDAYYDKFEESESLLLKYKNDPSSFASLNIFESSLKKYMVILGWALSILIISSYVIKVSKIGLNIKDADKVSNNMLLQLPMYLMLVGLIVPIGTNFPFVVNLLLSFFIVGVFINSLFVTAVLPSFIGLLTSEQVFDSNDIYLNSNLLSEFNESFQETTDSLSDSIVVIDLILSNVIEDQYGEGTPSDSKFRELFKSGEHANLNESCVDGKYWHMNILTKNECKGFSNIVALNTSVLPQKYEGDHFSSIPTYLYNTISTDNEKVKYEKAQLVSIYEDLLAESYRKADLKKELICSGSNNISNSRLYKKSWFCNKFDYETGAFVDGEHYAESVMNSSGLLSSALDVSVAKSNYQSDILVSYDDKPDTENSLLALKESVKSSLDAYDSAPFVITLYSDNILNGFYSIVNGLEYSGSYLEQLGEISTASVGKVMNSFRDVMPLTNKTIGSSICDRKMARRGRCGTKEDLDGYEESAIRTLNYFEKLKGDSSFSAGIQTAFINIIGKNGISGDSNIFTTIKQNLGIVSSTTVVTLLAGKLMSFFIQDPDNSFLRFILKASQIALTLIKLAFFVCIAFFIFGIVSFFLSFIILFIGSLYRLVVHIIMIPLYVLRFLWEVNDAESDEDNVLIPEKIKNVLQRVLVEPLAVSASFLGAALVVVITYWLGAELFALYSVMGNVGHLQVFKPSTMAGIVMSFLVKVMVSAVILVKGSEFMDYLYRKITEFISDGTSISPVPPNELDQIKDKAMGIFYFKGR